MQETHVAAVLLQQARQQQHQLHPTGPMHRATRRLQVAPLETPAPVHNLLSLLWETAATAGAAAGCPRPLGLQLAQAGH